MENKQILKEWNVFEYDKNSISESRKLGGPFIMKGILQKSETVNQNGRIYPQSILAREIKNYQKFIQENRALGELDHPDSSVVELKNASHIIREAYMQGNVVYGTVEVLNTPSGKILQSLVESGVTLGISSRGVGSTRPQGDMQIVQDDFQLICWDFVSEPSTPGAFMMKENKNIDQEVINEVFNKTDRIDRLFNEILDWENNNDN